MKKLVKLALFAGMLALPALADDCTHAPCDCATKPDCGAWDVVNCYYPDGTVVTTIYWCTGGTTTYGGGSGGKIQHPYM